MNPIPVSVGGFTWTAALVAILNVLVGGLLVQMVKAKAPLKKIAADREANLLSERAAEMEAMRERIGKLEEGRDKDRTDFEAKLEAERAMHEAEIGLYRHRANNLQQCFDSFLMLMRKIPEAEEIAVQVQEMRATQMKAEAVEKAEFYARKIAGRATA